MNLLTYLLTCWCVQKDINKRLVTEQARSRAEAKRLKELQAVNTANQSLIQQLMARLADVEAQVNVD